MVKRCVSFVLAAFLLFGCASILKLNVTYTLPEEKTGIRGPVMVQVRDLRPSQEIFTEKVKRKTGAFSKDIQLSLAYPGRSSGFMLGIYDVAELFQAAFQERLKAAGMETSGSSEYRLLIELQEFLVDILDVSVVEKKWYTRISYQATLYRGENPVYSKSIRADSEKLRYWKDMGLDELVSDTFSSAINNFELGEALRKLQ